MNKYLITFRGSELHSRIVEAPDASSACNLCIEKIATWEEIPDSLADKLIECGTKFVKWPY